MNALTRRPIWLGYVLTPLIVPAVFLIIAIGHDALITHIHQNTSLLGSLLFTYLFGVPAGYVAMAVLGWPLITVLRRHDRLMVAYVCLGAAVAGALTMVALSVVLAGDFHVSSRSIPGQIGWGLVMGLLAGLIFCAIVAVPVRRPR